MSEERPIFPIALKVTRHVILAALVAWFAYQCVASVRKLLADDIGTSERLERGKRVFYPSLTLCPFQMTPMSEEELAAVLGSDRPVGKDLLWLHQGNFLDRDGPVEFNSSRNFTEYEESGILSVTMSASFENPARCVTYDPPGPSEVGFQAQVSVALNATGYAMWLAFVHNRRMNNPNLDRPFGSAFTTLTFKGSPEDPIYESNFEIMRMAWTGLNRPGSECKEDGQETDDIQPCVLAKWESEMNCTLPWLKTYPQKRKCSTPEELNQIFERLKELINFGEQEIADAYGCLSSCNFTVYDLRETSGRRSQFENIPGTEVIRANFMVLDSTYLAKKQYIIYDHGSLIADVGGYLGLLLGQSILTFYDVIISWLMRFCH